MLRQANDSIGNQRLFTDKGECEASSPPSYAWPAGGLVPEGGFVRRGGGWSAWILEANIRNRNMSGLSKRPSPWFNLSY